MSLKKQSVEKGASAQQEQTNGTKFEPAIIISTLYERITRDISQASKYISITDILGVLETIKLSTFNAAHLFVAEKFTDELTKTETQN